MEIVRPTKLKANQWPAPTTLPEGRYSYWELEKDRPEPKCNDEVALSSPKVTTCLLASIVVSMRVEDVPKRGRFYKLTNNLWKKLEVTDPLPQGIASRIVRNVWSQECDKAEFGEIACTPTPAEIDRIAATVKNVKRIPLSDFGPSPVSRPDKEALTN